MALKDTIQVRTQKAMSTGSKSSSRVKLALIFAILLVAVTATLWGHFYKQARDSEPPASEVEHLHKAALAGDVSAMNSMGLIYYEGRNVARDEKLAQQWFEKAAAAGNTSAMNNLGLIYEHPVSAGTSPDYRLARSWFEKAVAAGDASGMFHLGVMYEKSEGVARNYQAARRLYETAAKAGNTDAQERLQHLPR